MSLVLKCIYSAALFRKCWPFYRSMSRMNHFQFFVVTITCTSVVKSCTTTIQDIHIILAIIHAHLRHHYQPSPVISHHHSLSFMLVHAHHYMFSPVVSRHRNSSVSIPFITIHSRLSFLIIAIHRIHICISLYTIIGDPSMHVVIAVFG